MLHGGLMNKITININDSIIVNQSAATTLTILHDVPTGGAYLRINVSGGTSNSGTLTITGNVNGSSTSETITFTAARWKITANKWDAGALIIITSGFADEAIIPTIRIDACDAAGNLIEWVTTRSFPARVRYVRAQGLALLLQIKQSGIYTPGMWEILVKGSPNEIDEGVEFTISKMKGTYVVMGQVQEHIQNNMIDFVRFYAVKRSD